MELYKRTTTTTYQTALLQLRAHRAFTSFMSIFLNSIDLSLSQWVLLGVLSDKGAMQPVQIAAVLGVKPPVATTLIGELERKRLLERHPHKTDSRSSLVALTTKGGNIVAVTEKQLSKELRAFMRDLTLPEAMVYGRAIAKLSVKLHR